MVTDRPPWPEMPSKGQGWLPWAHTKGLPGVRGTGYVCFGSGVQRTVQPMSKLQSGVFHALGNMPGQLSSWAGVPRYGNAARDQGGRGGL